jgi:hypothetical protein
MSAVLSAVSLLLTNASHSRLASRAYKYELVVHDSRAKFKAALTQHQAVIGFSFQHTTSPLVLISSRRENVRYYLGGFTNVCNMF